MLDQENSGPESLDKVYGKIAETAERVYQGYQYTFDTPQGPITIPCPFQENKEDNVYYEQLIDAGKGSPGKLRQKVDEIKNSPKFLALLYLPDYNEKYEKIYNYLMSKGVGLDCSGLVNRVQEAIWKELGLEGIYKCTFEEHMARIYKTEGDTNWSMIKGTAPTFYLKSSFGAIKSGLKSIRPGDILVIGYGHSAAVGGVNQRAGVADYLSCTDAAAEKGVHRGSIIWPRDSWTRVDFNPSLTEPGVSWRERFEEFEKGEALPWNKSVETMDHRVKRGDCFLVRPNYLANAVLRQLVREGLA